jgi:N-acetylglucosamine kinase-like BadF-type ATPase
MTSRAGHAGRIFIGVDAGATKIRAAILDTSTGRIARIEGSGSNAVVDGPEAAAGRIVELLSSLSGIGGIAVGLAGAWSARIRGRVAAILRRNLKPDRLTVMNDASAVLAAMAPSTNAVLLNVGTGSVAVGRTRNGRLLRADGWGPLAGDAGSGYWIGRRALESALKAKDGRGPRTALARTVLRKTGIERPEENIHRLYSSPAPQAIVASLAPLVIRAARHGDSTARGIVRDAAAALASTAGAVLRRMPSGRTRLFAAGGLGTSAPELFAKVRAIAG